MRIIKIFICFIILLLMVQLPVYAGVSAGLEWRYQNDESSMEAVMLNLDISKHWTIKASYDWEVEDLTADLIYKTKTGGIFQPYYGLGVRDVLQKSNTELSLGDKAEIIVGMVVNLSSNPQTGIFLTMEMKAVPSTWFKDSSPEMLDPIYAVTVNYRIDSQPSQTRRPNSINESDFDLLIRLVTAEAGNEPFEGQVAVAAVVLNRVVSYSFPNTIRDVIYQNGQFSSLPKLPALTPTEMSRQAVVEALNGKDPSNGALYFYNPRTCSKEGLAFFNSGKLRVTARIGNHTFLME